MVVDEKKAKPWIASYWWLILLLILFCLGLAIWVAIEIGAEPGCAWSGVGFAWIDTNANGTYDPGEPPLPGVTFHVEGGSDSISDWKGEGSLLAMSSQCMQGGFNIYPDVPSGYRLTTKPILYAKGGELDKRYAFGFTYLPGIPTVTPRPPPPICKSYPIGVADEYDVTDIAVAADGSIWAATYGNGVVHYLPDQDRWVRYTTKDGLASDQVRSITPLKDGSIWFAGDGGASLWNGSKWTSFTYSSGLINTNVYKIAQAPDGSLWFAMQGGVSHFIPNTNTWISYTTKDGLADNFVTYVAVTPDGSVWFPTVVAGLSRLILPTNSTEAPRWITYREYPPGNNAIPFEDINQIQVAPNGIYWFAGLGGLMQFNPKNEAWLLNSNYSSIAGAINSFTFGPDGSIWIATGTDAPAIYHSPLNGQNIWEIYDNRDGLPVINKPREENGAVAVAVPLNNVIWVATREDATQCIMSKK